MIMIVGAGIETLIQTRFLKLPVAQAQAIIFIAAMIPAVFAFGPIMVWVGLLVVSLVTILLVIPFKHGVVGRLLPYLTAPVVIGTLFIVMGVSLVKVASIDLIFPLGPEGVIIDPANFILALIAILVPIIIVFVVGLKSPGK